LARSGIEEKIRWFNVSMDDFPRMDVAQSAKHTAQIGFDSGHG
jgi:hypothetical protein